MATNDAERETLLRTIESRGALGGRFDDIRRLGRYGGDGHFSLVVTARDVKTNDRVALKFFHPYHLRDQYRWNCFVREPTVLQMFTGKRDILQCLAPRDEFTVPFTHMGDALNIPFAYYAVELASCDVNSAILTDSWTPMQKLVAFRVMCRAVQRIHAKQVVHRDLKPSNFLVMPDGTLRLSDFGTARDLSDASGGILATYHMPPGDLGYAAPEIMASLHDVDPSFARLADLYSLGAILFELFARTQLVLHLFDKATLGDLHQIMATVDRTARVRTYNGFVTNLANAHPLPSLRHFGGAVPPCLLQSIDRLYQGMAAVDYNSRLSDFKTIFSLIDTSIWMLQHEDAYRRWRAFRARMREGKQAKRSEPSPTKATIEDSI
jgi:serine/threonine protein kinase